MLQNLAVILEQLHYGKISFIVLATDDARADEEAEQAARVRDELGRHPPLHRHPLPDLPLPEDLAQRARVLHARRHDPVRRKEYR